MFAPVCSKDDHCHLGTCNKRTHQCKCRAGYSGKTCLKPLGECLVAAVVLIVQVKTGRYSYKHDLFSLFQARRIKLFCAIFVDMFICFIMWYVGNFFQENIFLLSTAW